MINKKLIYDIGFHKGEDTQYFLHLGYNVVGVDADPRMVELATKTFASQVQSGQLKMLNYAVSETDGEEVEFNVSEWTLWNSLRKEVATRDNVKSETIKVKTGRLDTIMAQHGTPYYCKIDIEGFDALATRTLKNLAEKPEYISVETECIGDNEVISDEKALETLTSLREVGYNRFKLVDQKTLEVLSEAPFYGVPKKAPVHERSFMDKVLGRNTVPPKAVPYFDQMKKKHNFNFPQSTTGPFGPQLEGEWVEFETARKMLLMHRQQYFAQKGVSNYSFWCDWHATKA